MNPRLANTTADRMAARRKSDRPRVYLCGAALRKGGSLIASALDIQSLRDVGGQ